MLIPDPIMRPLNYQTVCLRDRLTTIDGCLATQWLVRP